MHVLVGEEALSLLLDAFVHLGRILHVLQVVLGLLVLLLHFVHLLLSEDELLVDVSLKGVVGVDQFLPLRVAGIATGVLFEHVSFLAIDLRKLSLEVVDLKFELLKLVLELVSYHSTFLACLLCTLDQYVNVLHHIILLGMSR